MIRKNIPSAEIRSWPAPGAPSATRPAARRTPWIAGLLALLAASGYSPRFGNPARVATGYISHVVCSYVFISGLDTARVVEEDIAGNPVFSGFNWALRHEVDQNRREVEARTLGGFESRAVYWDGLGCLNLNGTQPPDAPTRAEIEADGPIPVLLPDIAGIGDRSRRTRQA